MSTAAEIEAELLERWTDMTAMMSSTVRSKWWTTIVTAYASPHRHYHTLTHLHEMFQHYDAHKDSLPNDKYATALAIFFHDLVYDATTADDENVQKSVEMLKQFSEETTLQSSAYMCTLIAATATHCTEAHTNVDEFGTDDVHYFLDFDMAILGACPHDYNSYREKIRKEYAHLDDAKYAAGRAKVLKMFLQIPNIYATREFRESYEERARLNIQTEIDLIAKTA